LDGLAVQLERARNVRGEWVCVGDVVRVQRRCQADRDDQQEEREGGERELVPEQPPAGQLPRTTTNDLAPGLLGIENDGFRFRLKNRHAARLVCSVQRYMLASGPRSRGARAHPRSCQGCEPWPRASGSSGLVLATQTISRITGRGAAGLTSSGRG